MVDYKGAERFSISDRNYIDTKHLSYHQATSACMGIQSCSAYSQNDANLYNAQWPVCHVYIYTYMWAYMYEHVCMKRVLFLSLI